MLPADLPTDLPSFQARFGTDEQCRDYLFEARWVPSRRLLDLGGGGSGVVGLPVQAARSMGVTASASARVCQPSTLRMVIWPEASSAQNSIAAVSAEGSTVCVLIRRLNSSCNRSIAFVVLADF